MLSILEIFCVASVPCSEFQFVTILYFVIAFLKNLKDLYLKLFDCLESQFWVAFTSDLIIGCVILGTIHGFDEHGGHGRLDPVPTARTVVYRVF